MASSMEVDKDLVPVEVFVDDEMIRVRFLGGLRTATPLSHFPRLMGATAEERSHWRLIGKGDGIQWPDADEDISVRGLIHLATASSTPSLPEVA